MEQVRHTPAFMDVARSQHQHWCNHFEESQGLSVAEAADIAQAIQGVPWPLEMKTSLLSTVAGKVAATPLAGVGSSGGSERRGMQVYTHIRAYLVASQWVSLQAEGTGTAKKLEMILEIAAQLGLRTPSEGTFAAFASLYLVVTHGLTNANRLPASQKHDTLVSLKVSWKRAARKLQAPAVWLQCLPERPADLAKACPGLWKAVFGNAGGPAVCPIDEVALESLTASVPMRKTNKCLNGALATGVSDAQSATMVSLMQMMLQQFSRAANPVDIQFLSPRATERRSSTSPFALPLAPPPAIGPGRGDDDDDDDDDHLKEESAQVPVGGSASVPAQNRGGVDGGMLPQTPKRQRLSVQEATQLVQDQLLKRDSGKNSAAKALAGRGKGTTKKPGGRALEESGRSSAKQSMGSQSVPKKKKTMKFPCICIERTRNQVVCRGARR